MNAIQEILLNYLDEDLKDGDHTTLSCIPSDATGKVKLLVKENTIIAGVEVSKTLLRLIDPSIKTSYYHHDGDLVEYGDVIFEAEGNAHSLLKAERLLLNIMQRMSGIANLTNNYAKLIKHTKAKVLDTRKTTPGFRIFEKMAVKIGGGDNHRMGLFDMILIKDNHIDFKGSIQKAIESTHQYLDINNLNLKIEIETRNLDDVSTVLKTGGIDRIMLDNFDVATTKKAVEMINYKYEIESSGGINLENIVSYAECGVDFISIGALTHSAKSVDLSLKKV